MLRASLSILAATVSFGFVVAGQGLSGPSPKGLGGPAPLEVSITPTQKQVVDNNTHSTTWAPGVDLTVKNVSGRCIVAYSLKLEWKDSEGNLVATGGETRFRHQKAQLACLDPGQTLGREGGALRVPLDPSGNATKADVTVDFVIFGDGSTWGPGTDVEQRGFLLGKYAAYKQLQKEQ